MTDETTTIRDVLSTNPDEVKWIISEEIFRSLLTLLKILINHSIIGRHDTEAALCPQLYDIINTASKIKYEDTAGVAELHKNILQLIDKIKTPIEQLEELEGRVQEPVQQNVIIYDIEEILKEPEITMDHLQRFIENHKNDAFLQKLVKIIQKNEPPELKFEAAPEREQESIEIGKKRSDELESGGGDTPK